MNDKAISFSQSVVPAILDGTKTQFRLVIKAAGISDAQQQGPAAACCPYSIGQRLWLRENWTHGFRHDPDDVAGPHVSIVYQADRQTRYVAAPDEALAQDWQDAYSNQSPNDLDW